MLVAKDNRTNLLKVALTGRLEVVRDREAPQSLGPLTENEDARFRNVLAHTGCRTVATDVVTWGIRMAHANAARLDVVHYAPDHVDDQTRSQASRPHQGTADDVHEAASRRLASVVYTARQIAGSTNGSLNPATGVQVRGGAVVSSLIKEIRDDSADLLVLEAGDLLAPQGRLAAILRGGGRKGGLSVLLVRAAGTAELKRVTVCIDFTPSSRFAARQAMNIARSCGAALRFICLYRMGSSDLQWMAETRDYRSDSAWEHEHRCTGLLREWMAVSGPDLPDAEVVCRQISNWDYREGLVDALAGEDADLLVLPLRRHFVLAGLQDAAMIHRIASLVKSSLLVVRR